jgi:hypothetical protein
MIGDEMNHNPSGVAHELREHLASDKRNLGFFMGAGTSMAIGLPGIEKLTEIVEQSLSPDKYKKYFNQIKSEISTESPNVELVLNRIRLVRELLNDNTENSHNGISGEDIKNLDLEVCKAIHKAVDTKEIDDTAPHEMFSQWIHSSYARRSTPVEIFTTNYDLMFEKAMEKTSVPFFDGFIGSVNPFFSPESVEADSDRKNNPEFKPPRAWTRLWKLHGSVNWVLKADSTGGNKKVIRGFDGSESSGQELMIFPSREKYLESRRLPFITFQDRLRQFLSMGESVLFILGYSFLDEHLNEIIFQALRSNSRLAVNALVFGEKNNDSFTLPDNIASFAKDYRNLSVYGPDRAVIGGVSGEWENETSGPNIDSYWENNALSLVDFKSFSRYLERFVGFGSKAFEISSVDNISTGEK